MVGSNLFVFSQNRCWGVSVDDVGGDFPFGRAWMRPGVFLFLYRDYTVLLWFKSESKLKCSNILAILAIYFSYEKLFTEMSKLFKFLFVYRPYPTNFVLPFFVC